MEQFCQQFLKGQLVVENHNDKSEKKKERDLNALKRPLTAFFQFSQKCREKVLERNQDIHQSDYQLEVKLTQISQMDGQKWNTLSVEERQPYIYQFNQSKSKYDDEIKDYNEKQGITTNEKKKKKSQKFDDKSIKSKQDYIFDDIDYESIQKAAIHQQQLKQQTENKKVTQIINFDEDEQIQETKQTKQQQQKGKSVKSKINQQMDDDNLQKDINQVIIKEKNLKEINKQMKLLQRLTILSIQLLIFYLQDHLFTQEKHQIRNYLYQTYT